MKLGDLVKWDRLLSDHLLGERRLGGTVASLPPGTLDGNLHRARSRRDFDPSHALDPVAPVGGGDLAPLASLLQAHVGDAELLGDDGDRVCPDHPVEVVAVEDGG